ncbi:MAG TPA: hypothetical protein PKG52_05435 [bacterium]|nr:hypothetical protein [bacterium]HPS29712.1 hypothetical protein [bacterium]
MPEKTPEKSSIQIENNSPEVKKIPLVQQILLKDRYNGEIYSLEKISGGRSVFIEISASWCSACKEMYLITSKLYDLFKDKTFFIRITLSPENETLTESPIPVMNIQSSPVDLGIEASSILPRIIILNRSGELTADLNGQYPMLYYYGILSEL